MVTEHLPIDERVELGKEAVDLVNLVESVLDIEENLLCPLVFFIASFGPLFIRHNSDAPIFDLDLILSN